MNKRRIAVYEHKGMGAAVKPVITSGYYSFDSQDRPPLSLFPPFPPGLDSPSASRWKCRPSMERQS